MEQTMDTMIGLGKKHQQQTRLMEMMPSISEKALSAIYFDGLGEEITFNDVPDGFKVKQFFAIKHKHIPHFQAFIRLVSADTSKQTAVRSGPREVFMPFRTSEPVFAAAENTKCVTLQVLVSGRSYVNAKCVDTKLGSQITHEDEELLQKLPESMRVHLVTMLKDGHCSTVVQLSYDVEQAAFAKVYGGTPAWAMNWAAQLKSGAIYAIIRGHKDFSRHFENLEQTLKGFRWTRDPLHRNFNVDHRLDRFRWKPLASADPKPEGYTYEPRAIFFDLLEWATVHAVEALQDDLLAVENEHHTHVRNLYMSEIAGAGKRSYTAWLSIRDIKVRIPPGTTIRITFKSYWDYAPMPGDPEREQWTAKVTSDIITCGNQYFVFLVIDRPWRTDQGRYSSESIFTIDAAHTVGGDMSLSMANSTPNKVRAYFEISTRVRHSQLYAIEQIVNPKKDRPHTEWNERMKVALLGSRLDRLVEHDVFRKVRSVCKDVTQLMDLNMEQKEAVIAMERAPGGVVVIEGAAGTGKAYLALEILKPFLLSRQRRQVLMISTTNAAADALANNVHELISSLSEDERLCKNAYVLRLRPDKSKSLLEDYAADYTDGTSERDSDQTQVNVAPQKWDALSASFYHQYDKENQPFHHAKCVMLHDKCVVRPKMSVGFKALEVAGIIEGPAKHPAKMPGWTRLASLRNLWDQFRSGENFEDIEKLGKGLEFAREITVGLASVIVTATDNAGASNLLILIQKSVDLIIACDSARELERSYAPIFAAPFQQLDGFVMLGDISASRPVVINSRQPSVFAHQTKIAFMSRLIHNGLPSYVLRERYRMNEKLSEFANNMLYDGQLTSNPSAMIRARLHSRKFQKWTTGIIGRKSSTLLMNMKSGRANTTELDMNQSRYNEYLVIKAVETARQLLRLDSKATIGVLSAYKAHSMRMGQACEELRKLHPDLFEISSDRLFAGTVNEAQDREFNYVIDCIPVTDDSLGLYVDGHCGIIGLTRARDGYVAILNVGLIRLISNQRHKKPTWISRFVDQICKDIKSEKCPEILPQCPYYQPQASRSRNDD